ncbi:MAG TPA: NUDIX domain-containing protein [Gemmatimonadaceae bacterium]|nr:NUDIX domain-containing protein [Gemmatimonadaceae bacterium]
MGISPYVARLRQRIGTSRLLLPSVAAIVYGELGEILLVRQRDGHAWSTPGGAVEPDENPIDTVVRETWEETGLVVQPTALIGAFGGPDFVVRYGNGDETQYVMSVFECSVVAGELTSANDEVTACRFISEAEFRTLVVTPWTREVLPLCYTRPSKPIIGPVNWAPPIAGSHPATV